MYIIIICTVNYAQRTSHSAQYLNKFQENAIYIVHCTLQNIYCILYCSVQCILYTVQYTHYTGLQTWGHMFVSSNHETAIIITLALPRKILRNITKKLQKLVLFKLYIIIELVCRSNRILQSFCHLSDILHILQV